jgi:ornithine cyclodeaminase
MPAWTKRYLGIKTVNVFPSNAERGLPGLFSAYTLFDATTGRPLAQMDGNVITSRRTAAASALAASYLARADSKRLSVLGAGSGREFDSSSLPGGLRPREGAGLGQGRAHGLNRLHMRSRCKGSTRLQATIGSRCARSGHRQHCHAFDRTHRVAANGSQAGSHLDLIGGFKPDMREADDASFIGVRVFSWVPTKRSTRVADLLGPLERGILAAGSIAGDLHGLCTQAVPGRKSDSERTVFKSVGTALEDLAAAIQVYDYWLGQKDQANNGRCLLRTDGYWSKWSPRGTQIG